VRTYILMFVLLLVVYNSNLRPIAAGDSLPASLIPFSILLDGSITLDRFGPYISENVWYGSTVIHKSGNHWYSVYPIAGPVLATPLYVPIVFFPSIRQRAPGTLISLARIAEKIVAAALAAGAAVFLLALLLRLTTARAAWLLTLIYALGTSNWSTSSQALWQHTLGQLAIIGCLYSIERLSGSPNESRWYLITGIFAACALAIRPTNIALMPALALVLWLRSASVKQNISVFAAPVLAAALVAAYNYFVFHRFAGGYQATLTGRLSAGLPGLFFSPGRGLLIYTPIAIFALTAFVPRARESRKEHWPVVITASVFSALHILLIAKWPVWWGGYCWGPRLLSEICAPVMILIAVGLPAIRGFVLRWGFAAIAVYCCVIQALGVYCYPKGEWDHLPLSVHSQPARLWNWKDNPVIRTVQGGVAWEPYSIVGAAATGGWPAAAKRLQQLGINPY
jgi:hypothetical protein